MKNKNYLLLFLIINQYFKIILNTTTITNSTLNTLSTLGSINTPLSPFENNFNNKNLLFKSTNPPDTKIFYINQPITFFINFSSNSSISTTPPKLENNQSDVLISFQAILQTTSTNNQSFITDEFFNNTSITMTTNQKLTTNLFDYNITESINLTTTTTTNNFNNTSDYNLSSGNQLTTLPFNGTTSTSGLTFVYNQTIQTLTTSSLTNFSSQMSTLLLTTSNFSFNSTIFSTTNFINAKTTPVYRGLSTLNIMWIVVCLVTLIGISCIYLVTYQRKQRRSSYEEVNMGYYNSENSLEQRI